MNRNDFVAQDGQPWWLWETLDSQTDEARRQLGMALGFSENEWYADPYRRTALYDLLESKGSNLLSDLDNLSYDAAKLQWVQSVTTLAAPPAPAQEDTTSPAQASAEAEAPPAAPAAAPPAKKSIFKAKQAQASAEAEAPPAAPAAAPPAAPAAAPPAAPAAAPPAKKSIFKAKQADPAPPTNGDTAAPGLDQAVQTVLADVTGGGLAGLASDLGVEAEDLEAIVNHPDFERDVREELARITTG